MKLLIDYREKNAVQPLIDALSDNLGSYDIVNMSLGDFQFINDKIEERNHDVCMIIERKTVNDLAASIKDGRYIEQKMRLMAKRNENPRIKLAYIIEGNYSFSPSFTCANINNKSMSGAIINSILRDNIIVWYTRNVLETNHLILNLYQRFKKDIDKYFKPYEPYESCKTYEPNEPNDRVMDKNNVPNDRVMESMSSPDTNNTINKDKDEYSMYSMNQYTSSMIAGKIHSVKKDNLNVKMCLEMQLACIPGVSSKKARDIVQTLNLKSIYDLGKILMCIEEHNKTVSNKEKKDVLQSVNGIGKKLAETIRKFVLNENDGNE